MLRRATGRSKVRRTATPSKAWRAAALSIVVLLAASPGPPSRAQNRKGGAASRQTTQGQGAGRQTTGGRGSAAGASKGRGDTRGLTHLPADAEPPRTQFESRRSDGMRLAIYQLKEGRLVAADPSQPFKSGDRIKMRFESNFDGHVYVVNQTPGGATRLIYPYPNRDNRVRAGRHYDLPRAGEFVFDREPGVEVIQVLMSRSPVPFLEAALDVALKNSHNVLDGSAVRQLEYLTGKARRRRGGGVFDRAERSAPKDKQPALARSLTLDSGKDDTVLVISGRKGTPSRLGEREVSVFEVRLQHQ